MNHMTCRICDYEFHRLFDLACHYEGTHGLFIECDDGADPLQFHCACGKIFRISQQQYSDTDQLEWRIISHLHRSMAHHVACAKLRSMA